VKLTQAGPRKAVSSATEEQVPQAAETREVREPVSLLTVEGYPTTVPDSARSIARGSDPALRDHGRDT